MKTADLNRFLLVCALVSDLYCPGYNPRHSLEKKSNLIRTATRHKVDSAKIAATVRAELSKPKPKGQGGTHTGAGQEGQQHDQAAIQRFVRRPINPQFAFALRGRSVCTASTLL